MPSLQIRDLPDDVYQSLAFRAEREHRSLAQQAVVELRRIPELSFHWDDSIERGAHLQQLIDEVSADTTPEQHGD